MSNDHYPDTTTFPRVRAVPAAVTERQRISKAVRGLPPIQPTGYPEPVANLISRAAVLEIIDGQP